MIDRLLSYISALIGATVSDKRFNSLADDLANHIVGLANELLLDLKNGGVFVGRRAASIRREAIAYFAAKLFHLSNNTSELAQASEILLLKIKGKFDPSVDIEHRNFHMSIAGGSASGGYKVNLLENAIDDRIKFYEMHHKDHEQLSHIAIFAFAAGHLLHSDNISKLSIAELDQTLKEASEGTKKNGIFYPDAKRDHIVLKWLSRTEPNLEDMCNHYLKIGKSRYSHKHSHN